MTRILPIAYNTYREAVRDRILYNLIVFALLIVGSALFVGQISIEIERIVLINMGLTSISLFGIVISILIGISLVWKEIERRTIYTVLAHPVRRWEFLFGKYLGVLILMALYVVMMFALSYLLAWMGGQRVQSATWVLLAYPMVRYAIYAAIAMAVAKVGLRIWGYLCW